MSSVSSKRVWAGLLASATLLIVTSPRAASAQAHYRRALATIYNFCAQSGCADGANPEAGLVLAGNGDFYGTTAAGGANGAETVFKNHVGGHADDAAQFR